MHINRKTASVALGLSVLFMAAVYSDMKVNQVRSTKTAESISRCSNGDNASSRDLNKTCHGVASLSHLRKG